jgi:hypothetical protein
MPPAKLRLLMIAKNANDLMVTAGEARIFDRQKR